MPKPVFISYSSEDRSSAEEICRSLEREGIECWIAPRDIQPGGEWAGAIVDAIESCRIMVLLLSEHANASPFVKSEVERAFSKKKTVIPFRLQDVEPDKALELFISGSHWIDAWIPPLADRTLHLAKAVRTMLDTLQGSPEEATTPPPGEPTPRDAPTPPQIRPSARVGGIIVVDSTGTQTTLTEFGIVYNAYATKDLANALKDELIVERGNATQNIPWEMVEHVGLPSLTAATITLRDGKVLGPVTLRRGSIVGSDEMGFQFVLPMEELRQLTLPSGTLASELEP